MSTSSNYPRSVHVCVHLDAIAHNYQLLRDKAQSPTFAVLKADAYGHGADAVASYLAKIADGFAVVTVGEAIAIRDAGIELPILVLQGPQDDEDLEAIVVHKLWPVLHDEKQISFIQDHPDGADIEPWLKVDTGMGRLGVSLESAAQHLRAQRLPWRGVLSHLSSADEPGNNKSEHQQKQLSELMAGYEIDTSLANSAGVLAWPSTERQWARVGIGLYGCHPIAGHESSEILKPAMTVTAPIIAIKSMQQGQIPRVLDSTADVLLHGVRCPIIGRVSMDSIAIDLRGLSGKAEIGDKVTIWGPGHSVDRLAAAAGTITYELLTKVQGRRTFTD